VHLGALADAVAAVRNLEPTPGELFCSTIRTPAAAIFPISRSSARSISTGHVGGYSVVRAHHSDIGG